MQRTLGLKRLLINLTILCAVFGVVAAFPQASVWYFLQAAQFAPAFAICWFLAYFSRCPRATFGAAFVGTIVGLLCSPRIMASWDGTPSW
jgi:hypothetical protein